MKSNDVNEKTRAHYLVSSLEVKHDDIVDQAWGELAQQRFSELESGFVKGVSWDEIKNKVSSRT